MKQINRLWNRSPSGVCAHPILDDCIWSRSPKLLQIGANLEPEIWVPVAQSLRLWDKRVNLLRDELGLPYVYKITLVCMEVRRGCRGPWISRILKLKKYFLLVSIWWKRLTIVGHYMGKSTIASTLEAILDTPQAHLCVNQGFSNFFAHVPLSVKYIYIYIISRHMTYDGVIKQPTNETLIFSFPWSKSFWSRYRSSSQKL